MRREHARRTIGRLASSSAIAFSRAFIVGIGVGHDVATHAVRSTGLGRVARTASACARIFATHAIDAEIARAFRISRARRTIRQFRASSHAVAYRRSDAFIVGIRIGQDRRACPIRLVCLGIAARFARTDARVFATHEVDARLAEAFVVSRARLAVRIDALARTITNL